MAFLGGSSRVTRSISSRKMMEGNKSHDGSGLWPQAPAPVRQLFWRLRRAVLRPKPKRPAMSFGYDLKSYSQNFDDGIVPVRCLAGQRHQAGEFEAYPPCDLLFL